MDKKPLPTLPEEPPEKTMSPKKVFAPSERNRQPSANSVTNGVNVVFSTPKPIKKECYVRTNSSYSSSNQLELGYDSNEPCSSAQAEARCRQNSDTGYSSVSPRPTIFSKFPPVATAQNDSEEETKIEEARIAELKKKGSPKTLVDMFKMEAKLIPMKKGEDTKSEKDSKQKKVKVVRPENMPVTAPNFFAGQEYGYYLTEMVNRGTETLLMIYERDPEKFFKRFDRKWYQRVMPLLFGKSHKTPAEIVKNLREVLIILDKLPPPKLDKDGNVVSDKKYDKSVEEVAKNVALIKNLIYGNEGSNSETDHVVQVAQLAQEIYNANILPMVVKMLPKFEFECKKDVGQIFNNLLRRQIGTRSPTVEYLGARPEILVQLVQGYTNSDIALTCGLMLRESIRHDHLAKMILYSDVFYTFFHYVQSEVFDIASDAFATFKELTTRHKTLCAEFLETHYDTFFAQYQNLLNSKNYVTRRQSLKLLGELLLDRHNFNIMHKYISNPENMRVLMELLRDKSRNIQYEAFHVFKVFVANPNKSKPICDILLRNREKLVEFLGEFHNDRTDDEQFNDEKAYLIKQIQEMKGSPKEAKKHKTKEDELITSVEAVTLADPTPSTSSQQ
ncbi:hypothetical protein L5515_017603 [Caenorhabditis briggsae]|uniref:Protein CBR-MOP-25.1 n=1 Tax=Caenorhabditis briggsae TaxID=6238 RepID=A0AAE9JR45_CAEBR|nr:hypothetical protein L5515_017603 [Caenorhabditis briggsae]